MLSKLLKKCCEPCGVMCEATMETRQVVLNVQTPPLSIPPFAGILKIFATVVEVEGNPIVGAVLSSPQFTFNHVIGVNQQTRVGEFSVTFEQPVCVGEQGATFFMGSVSIDPNNLPPGAMSFTVVYCPDFCRPPVEEPAARKR